MTKEEAVLLLDLPPGKNRIPNISVTPSNAIRIGPWTTAG